MIKGILIRIPFIYKIRVSQLRAKRRFNNVFVKFATSDPQLQENKVTNLSIALKKINKIEINPGETFSFWDLVGKPTMRKGYIEGMQLSQGEVKTGVGGGLCQLANLLFWLVIHRLN